MKTIHVVHLLFLCLSAMLSAQNNAKRLSIESFYADEGPLNSREYKPDEFSGVMPGDPGSYISRGMEKLKAKLFSESLADFTESINLTSGCGTCYYYRGLNYFLMDSLALAKEDFKTALYHDVLLIEAYNDLSNVYYLEEKLDSAEIILEQGIKYYPSYLPSYFNLGYYKLMQGRRQKAMKLFDKCLEMDSCHIQSATMKAAIYFLTDKYKDAESQLDKIGKCNPDIVEVYLLNAVVKSERNKPQEAIEELNKALRVSDNYINYFMRGLLYVDIKDYELAIKDFHKSYEMNSLEEKGHKGSYSYRKKQLDFQGILKEYEEQKRNFSADEIRYIEKGICHLITGDYDIANSELKKLTKVGERNDFYYLLQGMAKEKSYDIKGAYEQYNKCLEMNSRNAEAYKRRGLLYQADGAFVDAINDFNTLYEINPRSSEALKYRGISKMLNEKYDLALADFDEYEQKFESDGDIFFNKGQCQNQMGLLAEAVGSFKKVLNLDPDDREVIFQIAQNDYSLGALEESMMMCDSILNNTKCHVMATNLKGVLQMDLNEHEKALATFDAGITCSPYYEDFHINKAIALIRLGRNADAVKQIDYALSFIKNNGLVYLVRAQAKYTLGNATACKDLEKAMSLGMEVSDEMWKIYCD